MDRPIKTILCRPFMLATVAMLSSGVMLGGVGAIFAADRENTIIVAQPGQINTLDPARADYSQTNLAATAFYDTLVSYDAQGNLIGRLATEFSFSDDVTSITMTLRSDVVFHDGTTFTARDVAYTLDRLKRLGIGVASLIEGYESTTVVDDTHLVINLNKPYSLFLGSLSKIYILNSALVEANRGEDDGQSWLQANDAGSGPYKLESATSHDLVFSRFDAYWDLADGRPEGLIYRRIDEGSTRRDELRVGNIDVGLSISDRDAVALAGEPGLEVALLVAPVQSEILFNTRSGPTSDRALRRALKLVYDFEGSLAGIRLGNGVIANGPVPTTLGCRPDLPLARQDLDAAKAALSEIGLEGISLTMNFQPVFDAQKQEATLFQSIMREVGVTLDLEPIAFPNYLASLSDPETIPQMMLLLDAAQFPDPGIMLEKGYRSTATGTNRTGYSNETVDDLLDAALSEPDADRRCDIYKEVQSILNEDAVMIDMYTLTKPAAYWVDKVEEVVGSPISPPISLADLRLAIQN